MEGGMASRLRACVHVCLCELAARARVRAAPKDMRVCLRMCARACQCARVQNVCVCVCARACAAPKDGPHPPGRYQALRGGSKVRQGT